MTKKTEYQVNFSYDLNQTGGVKHDTFLIRAMEKIGGSLTQKYEDEYGGKDLTFTINSDLSSLQHVVKEILHDLEAKHVKLNATAQKIQHIVSIDSQQFNDFSSFEALASGWASEKLGSFQNQGNNINVIVPNKGLTEDFLKNILPQAIVFTKNNQNPVGFADILREPVINSDNYMKRKPSL